MGKTYNELNKHTKDNRCVGCPLFGVGNINDSHILASRKGVALGSPLIEKIRDAYRNGYGVVAVAASFNTSTSSVRKYCRDIIRTRSEGNQLAHARKEPKRNYTSCHRRARRLLSKYFNRELRRDEHVHHIDGDWTNNELSNLEILTPQEHIARHRNELNAALRRRVNAN